MRPAALTVVIQLSDNISALCRNSPAACTVMGKIDSIVTSQQTSPVTLDCMSRGCNCCGVAGMVAPTRVSWRKTRNGPPHDTLSSHTRSDTLTQDDGEMGQHLVFHGSNGRNEGVHYFVAITVYESSSGSGHPRRFLDNCFQNLRTNFP